MKHSSQEDVNNSFKGTGNEKSYGCSKCEHWRLARFIVAVYVVRFTSDNIDNLVNSNNTTKVFGTWPIQLISGLKFHACKNRRGVLIMFNMMGYFYRIDVNVRKNLKQNVCQWQVNLGPWSGSLLSVMKSRTKVRWH